MDGLQANLRAALMPISLTLCDEAQEVSAHFPMCERALYGSAPSLYGGALLPSTQYLKTHAKGANPETAQHWFDRLKELEMKPDTATFNIMVG